MKFEFIGSKVIEIGLVVAYLGVLVAHGIDIFSSPLLFIVLALLWFANGINQYVQGLSKGSSL